MKKTILISAVVVLSLLVLSTSVFAYGGGFGQGGYGSCVQENLTPEQQGQFQAVMENFRAKMEVIREKIFAARENGDTEAFEAAKEERLQVMEEKRAELSEIAPQFAERFQNCGRGMRNNGLTKGSGAFGR